jgi:hypothetical protein
MAGAEQPSAGTAARSDDGVLALARERVGAHFGLSAAQSARLRGSTKAEIEADAKAMRGELGLPPLDERERDEGGRYASGDMNARIRAAAGR